jgi:hypothetical protein
MAAGVLAVLAAAACGRKGNPLPPLRPPPGALADVNARRIDDRVELRFTIPAANADGTTPSVIERIEIYLSPVSAAPAPTVAQVMDARNLKGRIDVRPADAPDPAPNRPPDPRPVAGDAALYVDTVGPDAVGPETVRHYVVVAVAAGKRRGPSSGLIDVPWSAAPPAPGGLTLGHDEKLLTLTWQPGAPGQLFRVYDVDEAGHAADRQPPAGPPLAATTWTTSVEFEKRRCFTVRAVQVAGPAVIEGAAAAPACVTPVDTFPPAPPTGLLAFPGDGSVELTWNAVEAPDVAGYIILRGDGTGERLQVLTGVLKGLRYTDAQVTRGVTYWYAVVAVDTSARQNRSGESSRQQVTVR